MTKKEREFQNFVLDWYEKAGRHDLPWRQMHDPYAVLVSELMLQQTQVSRVVPKYERFMRLYPTVHDLANATLGDVLRLWQGLGYNRRAKFLHQCAQSVVSNFDGTFPTTEAELLKLPGIGPYTASAVCAFAYNQPVVLVETNVRQVVIHHFYKRKVEVTDREILEKVRRTLPTDRARDWYAALMDYGTQLKSQYGNNTRKMKGYTRQSQFKGSDREVRAAIVRVLTLKSVTKTQLYQELKAFLPARIDEQLENLIKENMITKKKGNEYCLP